MRRQIILSFVWILSFILFTRCRLWLMHRLKTTNNTWRQYWRLTHLILISNSNSWLGPQHHKYKLDTFQYRKCYFKFFSSISSCLCCRDSMFLPSSYEWLYANLKLNMYFRKGNRTPTTNLTCFRLYSCLDVYSVKQIAVKMTTR